MAMYADVICNDTMEKDIVFDHVEHDKRMGVSGGLKQESTDNIIMAFHGRDTMYDWIYNMIMVSNQSRLSHNCNVGFPEDVMVHTGFKQQFMSIIPLLLYHINNPPKRCKITGYSFGGAIAHIVGVYLSTLWPRCQVTVVSFGSPMVGNHRFSSYVDQRKNLECILFLCKRNFMSRISICRYVPIGQCITIVSPSKYITAINHSMKDYRTYLYQIV